MKKKKLQMRLAALKEQEAATILFIGKMNKELQLALDLKFKTRHDYIKGLLNSENLFLQIIKLKIQEVESQLNELN